MSSTRPTRPAVRDGSPSIEAGLRSNPEVDDCVVVERQTSLGETACVAYVTGSHRLSTERLEQQVRHAYPAMVVDPAVVQVGCLPLTSDGQVDRERLARVPILDESLCERWQHRVESLVGRGCAVATVASRDARSPRIHLADALPGWTRRSMGAASGGPDRLLGRDSGVGSGEPSISHGPSPEMRADIPSTLPEALERAVRRRPDHGLVYIGSDGGGHAETYADLLDRGRRVMTGLRRAGLAAGDKVILQLSSNQELLAALWGCVLGGFVAVPVSVPPTYGEENAGLGKLLHIWSLLERPTVIAAGDAVGDLGRLPSVVGCEPLRVLDLGELLAGEAEAEYHASDPDDLVVLLLTSGSTSLPKAVCQSHRALLAQAAGLTRTARLTDSDVTLNWFPLDHVVGIAMCHLQPLFACGRQVHVASPFVLDEPLRWLDLLEAHRVTVTWAPNFAYGLINAQTERMDSRKRDLSSLRFILNGGEAVVSKTARTFLRRLAPSGLSPTAMMPGWGMAETSSGVVFSDRFTLDRTSDQDAFVALGQPIPGVSIRIVDDEDAVVPAGSMGRLQVRGTTVTSGYYGDATANAEAFTADGWFNTGDLGRLDAGSLTLTGREKEMIIVNGLNYPAHEIEKAVEEVPGVDVSYVAAFSIRGPGSDTDELAIAFASTDGVSASLLAAIRERVASEVGVTPRYLVPVTRADVPKTQIGKIQREALRSRFASGGFADQVKTADLLGGSSNTLPGWFYTKVWRRRHPPPVADAPLEDVLLLAEAGALGDGVAALLEQGGARCRRVAMTLDAGEAAFPHASDYATSRTRLGRVLSEMRERNSFPHRVVHLWSYEPGLGFDPDPSHLEQKQRCSLHSLLALIQALEAERDGDDLIEVVVVSSQAQRVHSGEEGAPHLHPMLGLMKTAVQEKAWLRCRHVDLGTEDGSAPAGAVVRELRAPGFDLEVAYRDGERWVPRLRRVTFDADGQRLSFRQGGTYVVSGGLGGVGGHVARRLLEEYEANLLLIGRTPLLDEPANHGGQDPELHAGRLSTFRELQRLPGRVRYAAVDVADWGGVSGAVARATAEWESELDGVIHLAGVTRLEPLESETPTGLSEAMRPKVAGTLALYRLVADRPDALFVTFSSVNGFFGGYAAGAYAAANAFLDGFNDWLAGPGRPLGRCLAWSRWDEIGASRGFEWKDASERRGYLPMTAGQGVNSLLAAASAPEHQFFIGLDGHNPHVRGLVESEDPVLDEIAVLVANPADPRLVGAGTEPAVRDRFGVPTRCRIEAAPRWALAEGGTAIDRDRLARGDARQARPQPAAELESLVASVWKDVLKLEDVGIHSNFFDLGATSVAMSQVTTKLSQALRVEVSLSALYEYPTIRGLAGHLDGCGLDEASPLAASVERGAARRQSRRRRGGARARGERQG